MGKSCWSGVLVSALMFGPAWVVVEPRPAVPAVDCDTWNSSVRVVGIPGLDGDRGAVEVSFDGSRQVLTRDSLGLGTGSSGDRFGAALSGLYAGYGSDGDFCLDLAVGAPGADGGGAVYVLRGSPQGFTAGYRLGLERPVAGDEFGAAVSAGHAVWVGAPGRDIGRATDAGAVAVFEAGATAGRALLVVDQGSLVGFPGAPEVGDRFGEILSTTFGASIPRFGEENLDGVFVGVPHEDVGVARDAGMVVKILYGPFDLPGEPGNFQQSTYWTQNTPGMPGKVEAGDLLGAAVAEHGRSAAFTAPGEDIGKLRDAGLVTFLIETAHEDYGDTGQYYPGYAISENSRGVPGVAESGDRFGASLRGVTYGCGVDSTSGYAIGVPGEDRGSLRDNGRVVLFDSGYRGVEELSGHPGTGDPTCGPVSLQQGRGAPGTAEAGDRFGTQIATTPRGNLAISAPGEDRVRNTAKDAGVVDYVRMRRVGPISEETLVTGARAGLRYANLWTSR
jgi:hypothetical protein